MQFSQMDKTFKILLNFNGQTKEVQVKNLYDLQSNINKIFPDSMGKNYSLNYLDEDDEKINVENKDEFKNALDGIDEKNGPIKFFIELDPNGKFKTNNVTPNDPGFGTPKPAEFQTPN